MSDPGLGIYKKYEILRTDGTDKPGMKHHNCMLFVLDITHDPHAREAAKTYARSCEKQYPLLAQDLRTMVQKAEAIEEQQRQHNLLRRHERDLQRLGEFRNFVSQHQWAHWQFASSKDPGDALEQAKGYIFYLQEENRNIKTKFERLEKQINDLFLEWRKQL